MNNAFNTKYDDFFVFFFSTELAYLCQASTEVN